MATPPIESLAIKCPKCGAKFRLAAELAGKRGRCAKCGDVFRVPAATQSVKPLAGLTAATAAPQTRTKPASETPPTEQPTARTKQPKPAPQPIPVYCHVCQTLMYGRPNQVGHPLKCPDCGAATVVPPPPVEKAHKPLAAMEGEQYEVWDVDDAPSVAEMIATQPKYVAVLCHLCQTLMHATPEQIGRKLKCPDCGALTVVEPPVEHTIKPPPTNDEYELEIDPELDPGERPPVIIPPRRPMLYEEEAEAALKQQAERHARGDYRGPQYDDRGHAVMPRFPLATRILPFLFSRGVPVRWLVLSFGALVFGWPILQGMSMAMLGGFGAVGGMSFMAMGLIVLTIWLAALSAIIMTIIVESSEGNDEVQHWPGMTMSDWLGEFFYMFIAVLVSPLPGWLLGRFIPEPATQMMLFLGSIYFALPVVILSQLEVGSAFGIASPRVIASFFRVPGSWLMFYVEIALVALLCLGATIVAAVAGTMFVAALAPLYIAAIVLCARILGRLAWKISESVPASDDADKTPAAA